MSGKIKRKDSSEHTAFSWLIFFILIISGFLVWDIPNRMYSFIGDEYAFYVLAQYIATYGISSLSHLVSQNGVYGYHPVADSALGALSMILFGVNVTGWKMLNVLIVSASSLLIYRIGLLLFADSWAALASAVLFAGSRYIFAFAHIGYNNLHIFIPILLTVWSCLQFRVTHKKRYAIISGISYGLLFYTFFSARIALIALLPLLLGDKTWRRWFIPTMLAVILPFFWINGTSVITALMGHNLTSTQLSLSTALQNLSYALQDIFIPTHVRVHHFVSGPPISYFLLTTAAFGGIILGIKKQYKLLLYFLASSVGIAVVIIATFYTRDLPTTRLHIIIPALALLGGYFFAHVPHKKYLTPIMLFIFLTVELYQFYILMPRVQPIQKEALAMQIIAKYPDKKICMDDADRKNFWFLFDAYEETIYPMSSMPQCGIIITSFGRLSEGRHEESYPGFLRRTIWDKAGQTSFMYYLKP
jgi:hypothetical protein